MAGAERWGFHGLISRTPTNAGASRITTLTGLVDWMQVSYIYMLYLAKMHDASFSFLGGSVAASSLVVSPYIAMSYACVCVCM